MIYVYKYRYILFFLLLREVKSMIVFFCNNFILIFKFNFFNVRIIIILNFDIILIFEIKL